MAEDPPALGPIDALFVAIRSFSDELDASRRWLARAEQTEHTAWRASFLLEARASIERAPDKLDRVIAKLTVFGSPSALFPPLDRIAQNLPAMRADVEAQRAKIEAAEIALASRPRAGSA